jgi:hypothetical protein
MTIELLLKINSEAGNSHSISVMSDAALMAEISSNHNALGA